MKKAIVMYSGGLDSRLVIKILEKQGFEIEALYFNLPFGCGCCNVSCNFNFTQKEKVKLRIFDVTKEPLLSEYIELLKNPKYGRGTALNPCKDCKSFIYKKAKEYADEHGIKVIASGEVLGQRPMSQLRSAMKIIDNEIAFELLRPLSAKLLEETSYEKDGLVDRSKLYAFVGRTRKPQMALAEEFGITYPTPGGGCLLCEKAQENKLDRLFKGDYITEDTLPLSLIGRHFMEETVWFVVARGFSETETIEGYKTMIPGEKGKPAVYYAPGPKGYNEKYGEEKAKEKALELQVAYSTGNVEMRPKFEGIKL